MIIFFQHGSLWEKIPVVDSQTQQNAPFANDINEDPVEQYPSIDDFEPIDSDTDSLPITPTTPLSPRTVISTDQREVWESQTKQDHLTIIFNDDGNFERLRQRLKDDFARAGFKWTDEEEQLQPWRFGLAAIRLQFSDPRMIDIQSYCLYSRGPIWLKLKREIQKSKPKVNTAERASLHNVPSHFAISLRYGAFLELNEFRYSSSHSWENKDTRWCFMLDNQRNGKGHIEWIIQNSEIKYKKQLLVTNINDCVVVDYDDEGFNIYIWQKYNLNEFKADPKENDLHRSHSEQHHSHRQRQNTRDSEQRKQMPRTNPTPRAPPPLQVSNINHRQSQARTVFSPYRRVGVHPPGCYFPVIQFSVRIDRFKCRPNAAGDTRNQMRQTLIALIDFLRAHNIVICYGKIYSEPGPHPHLFFREKLPNFPQLISKYSWQMLSINGYGLQLRIDDKFIERLHDLQSDKNAEELFYRVCVYLSRIFSLKPFLNIDQELKHAITESRRKRDNASYGMVRKLDCEGDNEMYVPSVTITPTTIRVKPLKLCRTNRVLRATEVFGKAVEHFILVDIRDENGQALQSYHFGDLHVSLLAYLETGFSLMNDDRNYTYLHHSQSQLRERQFWFYHHDPIINYSSTDAYEWMGDFSKERNPAKYAARIALCFSTTKATVRVIID